MGKIVSVYEYFGLRTTFRKELSSWAAVWLYISARTFHFSPPICVIFSRTQLQTVPMRNFEFHENQCSERHTLRKDLNKILPYFLSFSSDLNNIRYRTHKTKTSTNILFCENRLRENHFWIRGVNEFLSVLSTSIVRFRSNSISKVRI